MHGEVRWHIDSEHSKDMVSSDVNTLFEWQLVPSSYVRYILGGRNSRLRFSNVQSNGMLSVFHCQVAC